MLAILSLLLVLTLSILITRIAGVGLAEEAENINKEKAAD
jgi:hypothetical protein